jgi:hypothetical protein
MFSRSIARPLLVLIQAPLIAIPAAATWVMDYTGALSPNLHEQDCQRPAAVSYAPAADELCVTDAGLRSLRVYSGRGIFSFATGGLAELAQPADASLTADGGFAVLDADRGGGRTLRRFDYRGEPLPFTPEPVCAGWTPEHLLLTADGGFVTVDNVHRLLAKHDGASGALLWSREIAGGAADRDRDLGLGRPAEGPDGRLYLPSGILHYVLVLSDAGEPLGSFGRFGATRGQFVFPTGVACGPAGTLLVLDRLRHAVLLFDAEQRFLAEYGSFGSRPGQFYHPNAIAAAPDGRVFIAQGYLGRVQCFRLHDASAGASRAGATAPGCSQPLENPTTVTAAARGCRHQAPQGAQPALAIELSRSSQCFNPIA